MVVGLALLEFTYMRSFCVASGRSGQYLKSTCTITRAMLGCRETSITASGRVDSITLER